MALACGSSRKVTRLETDTVTDLSGKWNDTDSRLVAEEMISDCLSRVWVTDFAAAQGRKPVVTVGSIRNRSSEHINTETFSKDFERELINSGKVRFVASREQRGEIRDERMDQQQYASEETRKRLAQETGADFLLYGSINSITDQIEGTQVVYYQTDLELINLESNEKSWIGTKKIKKEITQKGEKW
ncbi:MAG: penicillin-binding protein activator LpoB [Candidatus Zixiibacteriota bacterium]|nr:MAG: penicillin-binding protein activator LpoB [candidate division Zixibacteria bacterium]